MVSRLGSRKRMVMLVVLLSSVPWLLMTMTPLLPHGLRVWALIPLAALALALLVMTDPAWGSWISDLVPLSRRGRFLGGRSSLATVVTIGVSLGAAAMLDMLHGWVLWGFIGMFALAFGARLTSFFLFSRMSEPPARVTPKNRPGLIPFVKGMPRSNLGAFTLYVLVLNFGAAMLGPFYTAYILEELGLSYLTYFGISAAANLATIISFRFWGPLADRYGNLRVLRFSAPGVSLLPLLLMLSPSPVWILFVQVVGSISWAGFNLLSMNFVYESSDDTNRTSNIGYYKALVSLAVFCASTISGLIFTFLPQIFAYKALTLFLISGLLRVSASVFLLPRVKEIRPQTGGLGSGQGLSKALRSRLHLHVHAPPISRHHIALVKNFLLGLHLPGLRG